MVSTIQQGITMKLKEKDDEIQRMGKLNWVLQERVKSQWVENQIWRDLAHTNEATANSLRSDLEQVLAHIGEDRHASAAGNDQAAVVEDDAKLSPNSLMAKSLFRVAKLSGLSHGPAFCGSPVFTPSGLTRVLVLSGLFWVSSSCQLSQMIPCPCTIPESRASELFGQFKFFCHFGSLGSWRHSTIPDTVEVVANVVQAMLKTLGF
ncbi:hypothetical protein FEM48_ZijujUnG0102300 [Ziziphus jujuba var. spinosa]|uniref:Uncharacterized protein n=1 Tax=Ziziphus jujuba var. spinosa TaxID=714518 RepID=A0A978U886_ZIZJJ|nr:hypothetical protein FEM48_ZijujUnG0102300 [Ziziphus jujuba var. spinosa]